LALSPDLIKTWHTNQSLPKLVAYRDSFCSALIPFMAPHFSRVSNIWVNQATDYDLFYLETEAPHDVIFEVTERNLDQLERIPEI
jgi:hypothetical protein